MVAIVLSETWAELVERARSRDPTNTPYPVPSGPQLLDRDVWLVRSLHEQDVESGRSLSEMHRLRRSGRADADRFLSIEGLDDAARWSRGRTRRAPVSAHDLVVTGESIELELADAVEVVREHGPGWQQAIGAYVWLRWLTGHEGAIVYPLW